MRRTILASTCLIIGSAVACPASGSGFREMLDIIGIEPDVLANLDAEALSRGDWEIVGQILSRLEQHRTDLAHWVLPVAEITSTAVGELMSVSGDVIKVTEWLAPESLKGRLEGSRLYYCAIRTEEGGSLQVLTPVISKRWEISRALDEPVKFVGVLLRPDKPLFLTSHLSWFPTRGISDGQLLMARHGMDAALWEEVEQKTPFIAPEKGRESEAFYSALEALQVIDSRAITNLAMRQVQKTAASKFADPRIAEVVAAQAERGLSSVVPLFLEPENHVGDVVRMEGTARRAVRVSDGENTGESVDHSRDYFELEIFTPDSQNYPVVCCVTALPPNFPTGDAIRTGVRVEGIFFKLWRYRTRELVNNDGETATQRQSYTPIVLASGVTWLQPVPAERGSWEIVVGGIIFALMMAALLKMLLSQRTVRRDRMPVTLPEDLGD